MYNNLQPTADYRTGRFGDTAAGKGRAVSPNPSSYTNMYSVPTSTGAQLNTYLNPPRTADSKPGKSLSPSKYNVPTTLVGGTTPSNYSPYSKIFTPITPSLTTGQINTKYNQVSSGASTNATNSPYNAKYGVSPTTYSLPTDFTNLTNQITTPYKPSQYYPPSSIYSTTNTISPPKSTSDVGKKDSNSNSSHSSPNYSPIHNHNQPAKISVQGSGESIAATKEDLVLLNRAKCVIEAGYIDPKKDSPSNTKGEEEFGRFSVIKSNYKENPYYYNLDDLPSFRQQNTLKTLDSYNESSSRMSVPSLFQFSIKLDNKIGDYKTFLQKQKAAGTKWRDESFPPTIHSLVGDNPSSRRDWQDLVWLRPEEFYGDKYDLFVGKIEPDDIKQGALGDCYFLSVLSSLAEWPDRIRKIFVDKEKNPLGCYCVRMCVMGEWREIVVDDYFPCDKRTKKPVFTIGNENELWVLVLEKAWAKIYGSYDNIEAGLARECLHDLTCAPTTFFLTDDRNEWDTIWKKMLKCEKKNYAMTCGAGDFFMSLSRSNSGYDMVNSKGLVGSHAYSLLGAYEVQSRRGKVKLLKLRNPWGKTEWNGAWSDNSSEWDESLKRALMPEKKDDGVFFIEYSDFLKYFTDIQFCFVNDSFKYAHLLTQSESKHAGYFRFTITQAGKYYFTINQESKRKFSSTGRDKYATVTIVLAKLNKVSNKWEYEHIAGNHRADREVWVKAKLQTGEYMIYSKIWWSQFGENDYALSSYGPTKVKFEQVNKKDYPELLQGAFGSKARKSTKKIDYAREGEPKAYSVVELKDGFVYCYYHNDSKRVLNVEVNYKEFNGLRLRKPYRGRQYQLSVNPGESKVVLAKVLPQENVRQAFSEKARFTNYDGPLPASNTTTTTTPSYQPTSNYSAAPTPKANTYNSNIYQPPLHDYKPYNPVITNPVITNPVIPTNPIITNPITTPYIPTTTTTTTTTTTAKSDLEIMAKIKGKKEKLKKPNSNEFLEIYVYEYKYEEGVIMLYENLTRNWTLNERVEYVGKGLFLIQAKASGGAVQEAEFELRPGSTYKLDFRRIEANPTLKLKFYSKFKELSSP